VPDAPAREPPSAASGDDGGKGWQLSGYLSARAQHDLEDRGRSASRASVVGLLRAKQDRGDTSLALQLRPQLARSSRAQERIARLHVDELTLERQLSPSSFVFAGRKRIVNGVALGRNPTDFLNLDKPEDRTLADDDRRAEKQGDDLVGWSYFGAAYSVQAAAIRAADGSGRTRALLQLAGRLDAVATDYSIIGYYADSPGLGLNASAAVGDRVTAYAEIAVRERRDRQRPVSDPRGMLAGTAEDARRWFSDIVVGAQYTSDPGQTYTLEYWRNANGYSDSEFSALERSLRTGQGSAQTAGRLIATPYLRQEKLFARASGIELGGNVELEATAIYGLDDRSAFARCALIWDVSQSDSIKAGVDALFGPRFSEYAASPVDTRVFLIYKRYF